MTSELAAGTYLSGVIEGFYGRPWSWADRLATVSFLPELALGTYIYAPKADPFLRRRWHEPWPEAERRELEVLAGACRSCGVALGVGLSPLDAFRDYGPVCRDRLKAKLAEIDGLGPAVLCVLFDDMRGDVPRLAALQARMVEDIASLSAASRLVFCPTYYSTDPVLERVFGAMPRDYWSDLGRLLDPAIDFFWTGEKVCSPDYCADAVQPISELMGRPPVLWDNYPVNDGARMSRFLHLKPFRGRPAPGVDWLRGHLVNPMNQAWLSRLPLCTLEGPGRSPPATFSAAVNAVCPRPLAVLLERDAELFSEGGLDSLAADTRDALVREYGAFRHPCAREVVAWLQEEYAFDPACLTD